LIINLVKKCVVTLKDLVKTAQILYSPQISKQEISNTEKDCVGNISLNSSLSKRRNINISPSLFYYRKTSKEEEDLVIKNLKKLITAVLSNNKKTLKELKKNNNSEYLSNVV
jgi:hypothetical protein